MQGLIKWAFMPLPMFKYSDQKKSLIKKVIAIAAGKGGVGKSTATVHLACALRKQGLSVGILDADLYGPSVRKMLREERPPSQKEGFFYPALSQGIKIMSMSFFRKEAESAAIRAPIANGIIAEFLKNVVWGELDALLIDFPPGTGDIQLTLCQKASISGALLITTPQDVSLIDVQKCAHLFSQMNVPLIGIVENMSWFAPTDGAQYFPFGKGGGERLARGLGIPLLGNIPLDPSIAEGCDLGEPVIISQPEAPISLLWQRLATQVREQLNLIEEAETHALKSFILEWKELP